MSIRHAGGRSRRALSAEERALWRGFVRSIKPLRARAGEPVENATALGPPAPDASKAKPVARARHPINPAISPAPPPPLAALERRERQRLARGRIAIDARIDLHGMSQGEAHTALAHFLRRAQRDGARFVLVITGKGAGAGERGILRRQVPLWLGLADLRDIVVGFEAAHMAHGGEGALYVRLRRAP